MAGSGLQQLLEVVFAQNSVTHMLTDKAIARAVRGHFLADAVLNALVVSITFNVPLQEVDLEGIEATPPKCTIQPFHLRRHWMRA